jgi:hypothetical protein
MTTYYIIAVAVTTAHIPNVLFEASSPDEACELVRSAPQSKGRATDQQLIDACRASRALLWVPGTMLYRDAKVWILAHVRKTYGDQARGILYVCT